jgi:hypothetical protein
MIAWTRHPSLLRETRLLSPGVGGAPCSTDSRDQRRDGSASAALVRLGLTPRLPPPRRRLGSSAIQNRARSLSELQRHRSDGCLDLVRDAASFRGFCQGIEEANLSADVSSARSSDGFSPNAARAGTARSEPRVNPVRRPSSAIQRRMRSDAEGFNIGRAA